MKLLDYHRLRREEELSWDRARLLEEAGPDFVSTVEERLPEHVEPWSREKMVRFTREPWFERCLELCELYRRATDAQRTWTRSRIDRKSGGKIGLFGLRAAVLGAREKSVDLARTGLLAYAIVDLAERDIRDTLIGLSLMVHCARLAGAEVPVLLRQTGALGGAAIKALYEEWASKYPNVQSIGVMGWHEVDTEEGIGFRC